MAIEVGINENVIIEKVEITDAVKGTLAFTFKEAGDGSTAEADPMAALGGDGYADTGSGELTIRLFCPLPPFDKKADGTPVSAADQQKQAIASLGDKKNILFQILNVFMVSDKIKFDLYKGTGLDQNNFGAKIVQGPILEKVYSNMSQQFVQMVTPFVGKLEHAVRLLLVRQSKTKHFADFRQKFVKENPFIESMLIPADTVDADGKVVPGPSKVRFTKFEIANKLNDATVLDKSAADVAADAGVELEAANVFGA